MSKRYFFIALFLSGVCSLQATDHVITINGFAYSPSVLSAEVGDNITITASNTHPTTEVSESTWNANGAEALSGGFGSHATSFTFEVETAGTIYYVCDNHVSNGMKGQINVTAVGVEEYSNQVSVDFGEMPITNNRLEFKIEAPQNAVSSIEVMNMAGQQVVAASVESLEGQLDLNTKPGVYIVLLKDANGQLVFREAISLK